MDADAHLRRPEHALFVQDVAGAQDLRDQSRGVALSSRRSEHCLHGCDIELITGSRVDARDTVLLQSVGEQRQRVRREPSTMAAISSALTTDAVSIVAIAVSMASMASSAGIRLFARLSPPNLCDAMSSALMLPGLLAILHLL